MKISVIGAGVVGVTTAYALSRLGHEVTVFDREPGPAMENSFANGGQLSYGFASPMGTPSLIAKIPAIAFGADVAFRLPRWPSPKFLAWSLKFTRACLPNASRANSEQLAALAKKSGQAFASMFSGIGSEFAYRDAGKLVLFDSDKDARAAFRALPEDGPRQALSRDACLEVEPTLQAYAGQIAGGVHVPADKVGDAALFSKVVTRIASSAYGAVFRFDEDISELHIRNGKVSAIECRSGEILATDLVVCCTGTAGKELLKGAGLNLPIFPIAGYSLTAPAGASAPAVAITDAAHKLVFSRIGDQVRIAGFADFGIPSSKRSNARIQQLIAISRRLIPDVADYDAISSTWVGARPATPDSLPIIGTTKVDGLYLNMGHGMFGWTLSAGAAEMIAEEIGPATATQRAA